MNQLFEKVLNESKVSFEKPKDLIKTARDLMKLRIKRKESSPEVDFYQEQIDLLNEVLYNFEMNS